MRTINYQIDEAHDGMQAGRFLQGKGYSRAVLTRIKKDECLQKNGAHIRVTDEVRTGDIITVIFKDVSGAVPNASLNADIVYSDEDVAVFCKPADMPVHTSKRHSDDTLENLYAALYPDSYFHCIGRLDKDTSGLIAVAGNKLAAARMMQEHGECRPEKRYYAVTSREIIGRFGMSGEIVAPIARESPDSRKRVVHGDGEFAHTIYRVIYTGERYCLHEITLVTGRTHQIRVHFAHIGFPLVGDELYGGDTSVMKRHALHCGKLRFLHPVSGKVVSLTSTLPDDMCELLGKKAENIVL